jgi:asparagine synthase (glutamine-hydrolysing)
MRGFRLKTFLKDAMRPYLPSEILSRRKQGFQVPLGRWLKGDLRDMTNDLLSLSTVKRRGYFAPAAVQTILAEHYSNRADNSDIIWALLNLESWHVQYVDRAI